MPTAKLTVKTLDAWTQPADGRAEEWLWDTDVVGLGVRLRASGTKTYYVAYKRFGKTKKYKLGGYTSLTLAQARERAREKRVEVDDGLDPAATRKQRREAFTLAELADYYFEQHGPELRPHTVYDYRRLVNNHVLPELGTKKAEDVTRRDAADLMRKNRSTPYQANQMRAALSSIYSFGKRQDIVKHNPCAGVPRFREQARERYLSDSELERFFEALRVERDQEAAFAFRLCLLTGARKNEAIRARWEEFNIDTGQWIKSSAHTKTHKEHRTPANRFLAELLKEIKAAQETPSEYLFPSPVESGLPRRGFQRAWDRVREHSGLKDIRLHDLRRTVASMLVSDDRTLEEIGRVLGHTQVRTTAKYAYMKDEPIREAVEGLGGKLARLAEGRPAAEVVPLHGEKRSANQG